MVPKRNSVAVSHRQSDMHDSWIYYRNHKALLRSTGHRFRDGRWQGTEDDFYVFERRDPPCLSERFPFSFPSYERYGSGDFPGTQDHGHFRVCVTKAYDSSSYYGSIANVPFEPVDELPFGSLIPQLNAAGTAFIVKHRPGNPVLNLGQFLVELRQLPRLPHFLRSETKKFKDLGSEYLNVEFGWKPFVKDVIALFNGQQRIQRALEKLVKDNGLSIRRRSKKELTIDDPVDLCEGSFMEPFGHLGDVSKGGHEELEGIIVGGPTGCADTDLYSFTGQCDYKAQEMVSTLRWQCGTFRYYVPDIGSDRWTAKAKTVLSGGKFTPSLLYEVMPWSWLIDWFTNLGDIVSNFSSNAVDNETLTNCFSMESQERTRTVTISTHWDYHFSAPFGVAFEVPAGSASLLYSTTEDYKARRQASPFGFGIPSSSFTARQWAILAALGVSRSRDNRSILEGNPP